MKLVSLFLVMFLPSKQNPAIRLSGDTTRWAGLAESTLVDIAFDRSNTDTELIWVSREH